MTRRLILSPAAERDLVGIWRYIETDNRAAADRFLRLLGAKSDLLLAFPGLGRTWRPMGQRRIYPVRDYLILYRETADGILVLRYIHGRRDLPNRL
ncbi:type II toxin-antitoxin system RelE/ParE family toxin [uncultured Enterovirga sp.]|uniref:type II toxin-antitoxin system RelE/ParE family toxin n=1 Tax=uncultured Enterovirga sp. TaxID=2026352 RepID=UPI0035CA2ABB